MVGLAGFAGSCAFSEKYNFLSPTGLAPPSHTKFDGGKGVGAASSLRRGSGASAVATRVASGRVGSFSPAGPVSTFPVTKLALASTRRPLTMHFAQPAGGRR